MPRTPPHKGNPDEKLVSPSPEPDMTFDRVHVYGVHYCLIYVALNLQIILYAVTTFIVFEYTHIDMLAHTNIGHISRFCFTIIYKL